MLFIHLFTWITICLLKMYIYSFYYCFYFIFCINSLLIIKELYGFLYQLLHTQPFHFTQLFFSFFFFIIFLLVFHIIYFKVLSISYKSSSFSSTFFTTLSSISSSFDSILHNCLTNCSLSSLSTDPFPLNFPYSVFSIK